MSLVREAGSRRLLPALALRSISWLVVLAPFLLYAVLLPRFGELQRNDYWSNFQPVVDGTELRADPRAWLNARSNEHRIALPLLLWSANILASHGDNRVLSALSLVLLLATFAALYRLLPPAVRFSLAGRMAFGLPLAALLATPVAAHCWVMGFSGNQWFLANFSAALALGLFAGLRSDSRLRELVPIVAAGLLGVFAHSTHLALWPALWIGAWLLPVPRGTRTLLALAAGTVGILFIAGYARPLGHPPPSLESTSLFDFYRTYLGMLATHRIPVARAIGTAALLLFGGAVLVTLRSDPQRRRPLVPWLLLAVYAGCNGIGTSVARLGFGETMALSSRYASLPALFWLGTLMTLAVAAWGSSRRRLRSIGLGSLAVASTCLVVPMYGEGLRQLREQLQTVRRQPLGALAMLWQIPDPQAMRLVALGPYQAQVSRAFFEHRRHIPFDRLADWPLGEPWSGREPVAPRRAAGSWQTTADGPPGFLRVAGALPSPPPAGARVLLLDSLGRVWGGGVFVPRPQARAAPLFASPMPVRTWFGYLRAECAGPITAFVELPGDSRLLPLATRPGAVFACRAAARPS